jgi:hypothetical protein
MNRRLRFLPIFALLLATGTGAQATPSDAALEVVGRLGEVNGQALACHAAEAVTRARELMLAHSPRNSRFADAFEQATQRGYLEQMQSGAPCPSALELRVRVESFAQTLREALPQAE